MAIIFISNTTYPKSIHYIKKKSIPGNAKKAIKTLIKIDKELEINENNRFIYLLVIDLALKCLQIVSIE